MKFFICLLFIIQFARFTIETKEEERVNPSYIVTIRGDSDREPRTSVPTAVHSLIRSAEFQGVLPSSDPFTNELPYESCAVVGNSPTILNTFYGSEIDVRYLFVEHNIERQTKINRTTTKCFESIFLNSSASLIMLAPERHICLSIKFGVLSILAGLKTMMTKLVRFANVFCFSFLGVDPMLI